MQENHFIHAKFISALQERITHKATLVNTVTDLLAIDKDAIYRRLSGKVAFSFAEMALIARRFGISLDEIVGIDTAQCNIRLAYMKHVDPSEVDYAISEEYINALKFIKDEPETKIMEGGNLFPNYLYFDYEYITRMMIFWWSQNSFDGKRLPFHEITIEERMRVMQKQACFYARHIKSTTLLWDYKIFEQFVSIIKFYAEAGLIKEEDIALIKNDLNLFLSDIEEMAVTGRYKETGNEVSLYIGEINADANLSYIESKNMRITTYWAFLINAFSSFEGIFYEEIKSWLHAAQKLTTLISVSGVKLRTEFFNTQRNLIDTL